MNLLRAGDRDPDATRRAAIGARRAFSLLELVAVMVIAGILAVSAVPAMSSLADARADAAARELHRDLSFARQRAVATGTRAWVVFDAAAGSWTVLAEDPSSPGRSGATAVTDPATGAALVRRLGASSFGGVSMLSAAFDGAPEVGFDWLGRPLNSGEADLAALGTVQLTGGRSVSVVPGTGLVTLTLP